MCEKVVGELHRYRVQRIRIRNYIKLHLNGDVLGALGIALMMEMSNEISDAVTEIWVSSTI